ncbi:hypothetical protein D3C85_1366850 [compost metagenome]
MIAIGLRTTELPFSVCSVGSAACSVGAEMAIPAASMCTAKARGRIAKGERGVTAICEHRRVGADMRTHI